MNRKSQTAVAEPIDPDANSEERARVAEQLAARLRGRGVTVSPKDTPDQLASLLESVERFEVAVESRGGDLMMDEAPKGHVGEPDNPSFVLPARKAGEAATAFISRVTIATSRLRS